MSKISFLNSKETPDRESFDRAVKKVSRDLQSKESTGNEMTTENELNDITKREKGKDQEIHINGDLDITQNEATGSTLDESLDIPSKPFISSGGAIIIGSIVSIAIIIIIIKYLKKLVRKDVKVKIVLGEVIDEKAATEEALSTKANKHKEQRNFREAIRYSFISLLLLMNEKNLIYLDETKTNTQLATMLRNKGFTEWRLFERIVDGFNEVWYGHREIDNEKYSVWEQMVGSLRNEVLHNESSK